MLLERGAAMDDIETGQTLRIVGAAIRSRTRNSQSARLLLEYCEDVDERGELGRPPTHCSARQNVGNKRLKNYCPRPSLLLKIVFCFKLLTLGRGVVVQGILCVIMISEQCYIIVAIAFLDAKFLYLPTNSAHASGLGQRAKDSASQGTDMWFMSFSSPSYPHVRAVI